MDMRTCLLLLVVFVVRGGSPDASSRYDPQMVGANRRQCDRRSAPPPNRVNTTVRLQNLRKHMKRLESVRSLPLDAYIVTSDDEHQSEYVADHDKRREFISGFSGSQGDAVVMHNLAALWTDGRYFLQADNELDCNWLLMRSGQSGVPELTQWLVQQLEPYSRVGVDPALVPSSTWERWKADLEPYNISLVMVKNNLIDKIWRSHRPRKNPTPMQVWGIEYAGQSWEDKVATVRQDLKDRGAEAMVVTSLDEVAWLLNIRGRDIPYYPVIRAYVIIALDKLNLYIPRNKLTNETRTHLKSDNCFGGGNCTRIQDYDRVYDDLRVFAETWNKVLLPAPFTYNRGASQAIVDSVPKGKRLFAPSPIMLMKAKKNPTERLGMRRAHVRDAAAICEFMAILEEEVRVAEPWSELNVSHTLNRIRLSQKLSQGISFSTIAGFGKNGALPHYDPSPLTNAMVDNSSTLVLDSGGQYLDGTTDVTRTFHFGIPTDFQRETYTRVLMGSIDLANLVFPKNVETADVDVLARASLWRVGLDYRHGTGHGIGAFLGVHESPINVNYMSQYRKKFEEGNFLSDEPGYYQDGEFGIRLENILEVVKKRTKYNFDGPYLGFRTITLVPYEPKLIKVSLLTPEQKEWLTDYNAQIRHEVGAELKKQRKMKGFYWMMSKTGPLSDNATISSCSVLLLTVSLSVLTFF